MQKLFKEKFADLKINESLGDAILVVSLMFMGLLFISLILDFLAIPAFRHDEIKYIGSYFYKLKTEGRWINFLFFDVAKTLNLQLVICTNFICFFVFCWQCFKRLLGIRYVILCSLALLFVPSLFLLNEWPQTLLLSFMVLMFSSLVSEKLPSLIFFLIFGVAFNGLVSHFYFLLPLLFLSRDCVNLKILIYWILGFVVGYLVAQGMTWFLTGSFIHLAKWRDGHPVHGVSDLIANIKYASNQFFFNIKYLGAIPLFIFVCSLVNFRKF